MKARPRSLSAPVSRRTLLHGVAGTAGAAMILGATPNSASAVVKLSQKVVAYQDHPDGDKRRYRGGGRSMPILDTPIDR